MPSLTVIHQNFIHIRITVDQVIGRRSDQNRNAGARIGLTQGLDAGVVSTTSPIRSVRTIKILLKSLRFFIVVFFPLHLITSSTSIKDMQLCNFTLGIMATEAFFITPDNHGF
jgi:hypothetical protein